MYVWKQRQFDLILHLHFLLFLDPMWCKHALHLLLFYIMVLFLTTIFILSILIIVLL